MRSYLAERRNENNKRRLHLLTNEYCSIHLETPVYQLTLYLVSLSTAKGRYIPGHTVSRKVKKYPDIQFQRNFLKFPKKGNSPITGYTI